MSARTNAFPSCFQATTMAPRSLRKTLPVLPPFGAPILLVLFCLGSTRLRMGSDGETARISRPPPTRPPPHTLLKMPRRLSKENARYSEHKITLTLVWDPCPRTGKWLIRRMAPPTSLSEYHILWYFLLQFYCACYEEKNSFIINLTGNIRADSRCTQPMRDGVTL